MSRAPVGDPDAGIAYQDATTRRAASDGCRALLRAQLKTGQHHITDPELLQKRRAEAGLA